MSARALFRVRPAVAVGALAGRLLALAPGAMPRSMLIAVTAGVLLTLLGMGVGAALGAIRDRSVARPPAPVTGGWLAAGLLATGVAVGVAARHEIVVRAAVDAPPIGIGWILAVTSAPVIAAVAAVIIHPRVWAATALITAVAAVGLRMPGPAEAARPDVPERPALVYGLLTEPGSLQARAARLVDRWVDADGLDRRAVVIAVPTGSGWVDAGTVDGVQRHFDGSAAVLALQYDDVPSWQAFVSSPDAAGDSAIAVLRAVDRRLAAVPPAQRPRVYLVGQSLGAVGADAARAWAARTGTHLDGTVLAGPPAGTVEALPACAPRVVLANRDDPVTVFGTALLWRPARPFADRNTAAGNTADRNTPDSNTADSNTADSSTAGRYTADDGDRRPWLPVVSMIGTLLDLPGALAVPIGHGHRYGAEQGLAIGRLPGGCGTAG